MLSTARTSVTLYGYFASATSALTDAAATPDLIPTSAVFGTVATGTPTTPTAFTQTGPFGAAAAGLTLFTQVPAAGTFSATRTDNLVLDVDLTSLPTLPAGTYTGTLNIQAEAL